MLRKLMLVLALLVLLVGVTSAQDSVSIRYFTFSGKTFTPFMTC